MEDAPSSVATRERSGVSAPIDLNPLLLQGKEYHESGDGDGTRERRGGDAKSERAINSSDHVNTGGEGAWKPTKTS